MEDTKQVDFDTMEAGREMDALVAEKVMGWKRGRVDYGDMPWYPPTLDAKGRKHNDTVVLPPYSTDIAAAWQVVETMAARGWYFMLDGPLADEWCYNAGFEQSESVLEMEKSTITSLHYTGSRSTSAEAICLAALKAMVASAQ